ncbi:MBL fold metallo-hydrolase [Gordonia sp. NPDC003424]
MTDVIEQVSDTVFRIVLPIPLTDLRNVNCYAIVGEAGITLIDPGWRDETSEVVLVEALSALGASPADVEQIFVTHAHWDHYTRAIDWQQRHGIPVHLGVEEHHTIDAFDLADGAHPEQARLLRRCGATDLADAVDTLELEDFERDQPFGPPVHWVNDDATFTCGNQTLRAHWTPGHTRGHVVYELTDTSLLFTGDHLLPRITPSLGFERAPEVSPLTSYLNSLGTFANQSGLRMLPAHGDVTQMADARARELLGHHRDRLEEIRGIVVAGNRTAYDVARQMTWTRRARALHELGTVHAMTAVLEVHAHLEHLARVGELSRTPGAIEMSYAQR